MENGKTAVIGVDWQGRWVGEPDRSDYIEGIGADTLARRTGVHRANRTSIGAEPGRDNLASKRVAVVNHGVDMRR